MFESENPRAAAVLANTIADLYIVDQLEAKFEATKRASEWLNERLADLSKKVRDSENAVELYRSQIVLVDGKAVSVTRKQITELDSQWCWAPQEANSVARRGP